MDNGQIAKGNNLYTAICKIDDFVYKAFAVLTFLTFTSLFFIVLLQVVSRLFMETSPIWTEELSRYLFIFSIAFASGLAYRNGEMVAVDILIERLKGRSKLIYTLFINILVILFIIKIIPFSYDFVLIGKFQTSPTLRIGMSFIYVSSLIAFINILFFSISSFLKSAIKILCKEY